MSHLIACRGGTRWSSFSPLMFPLTDASCISFSVERCRSIADDSCGRCACTSCYVNDVIDYSWCASKVIEGTEATDA